MSLRPNHLVWQRERPLHHAGAIRTYLRDVEDDAYPCGPDGTPKHCATCAAAQDLEGYDSASPSGASWYISSSTESSPEFENVTAIKSTRIVGSRFDLHGMFL